MVGNAESVCLIGGEEIPPHQRMHVFRMVGTTAVPLPGRVCIEHGGNGRNTFARDVYLRAVLRLVVQEYARQVDENDSPDFPARANVAQDDAVSAMVDGGAFGEAVEVALGMGFDVTEDDFRAALADAVCVYQSVLRGQSAAKA